MDTVAIIAEYNPMHNGHILNIEKAKEYSKADNCLVIMSGSFTQQGNVACIDKFERAKCAIENGADIVVELPVIYAVSSAEDFATGAVTILNEMNIITHLAFGAETNNLNLLINIAKTYVNFEDEILFKIKQIQNAGINHAKACNLVLKDYLNEDEIIEIQKPNNILAIEYLKALIRSKSQIKPILVKREVSSHNSLEMSLNSKYASSTAIRNILSSKEFCFEEKLNILKEFVPQNTLNLLTKFNTNHSLFDVLKYEILKLNKDGLKCILDVNEGLENKLYNEISNSNSYEEFIFNVKSKRYTLSRIKRICIYIILGITKEKKQTLKHVKYARILKIKKSKTNILSMLNKTSKIPVITKVIDNLSDDVLKESLALDILANNLIGNINKDYTNNIIV